MKVGDRVEARYRGRARAYPGRIARENGDGTYDVEYDNGDKEQGVAADLINWKGCGSAAEEEVSGLGSGCVS